MDVCGTWSGVSEELLSDGLFRFTQFMSFTVVLFLIFWVDGHVLRVGCNGPHDGCVAVFALIGRAF